MDDNDFEKLCKSLEQAIAYAAGEKVEGVIIHKPKKAQIGLKETPAKKYVVQNHTVHDSVAIA